MHRDGKIQPEDEDPEHLFWETVRALAKAIDEKDHTRGHSERVTRFSVEIARILELSEEEIEKVTIGALIHDVGKLAIDDHLLKKPATLTEEEYEVMKTHTTRGYEMLKHIPQLKDIMPGLQSHHEQLDGNGYPRGLKGEEIPMIARIIMVADCFDAMTAARPYHEPAPVDHALTVIRSFAGAKYDERVVAALIQAVETGRIVPSSMN
jgi:HD-GYP domain-containing protein (c-di-GMP phosphodiesterase class II)